MRNVHLDTDFLNGRTVVDRNVEVPGTGLAWVGDGEAVPSPEY